MNRGLGNEHLLRLEGFKVMNVLVILLCYGYLKVWVAIVYAKYCNFFSLHSVLNLG